MPWSPPKKATVVVTLFIEIFGLIFGLIAVGVIVFDAPFHREWFGLIGAILCFVGWFILLLGVMLRGI